MSPQNNDQIIHDLIKKVTLMERDMERLSSLNPLYQILNTNEPSTAISASQNAYNPGDYDFLAITASTPINLNGMIGGVDGRFMLIRVSGGSSNITITHQSASAAVGNKFSTYTGASIVLAARQAALIIYDTIGGVSSWVVLMST